MDFDDGTFVTMRRRERPHIVFDPVSGVPTHLINAVLPPLDQRDPGGQHDQSYSLIVPLTRANIGGGGGGGGSGPANDLFSRAITTFPAVGDTTGAHCPGGLACAPLTIGVGGA